jgi:hypothetical protein
VENLTVEDTIIDNLQPGDRQYCILFQSLNVKDKISQNTPKVSCNKDLVTLLPWKVDKQKALNDSKVDQFIASLSKRHTQLCWNGLLLI